MATQTDGIPRVHTAGDSIALPAGYTVLEYRIEKILGSGGFGLTYLAHDINLELPVALKEYFPAELTARSANHSVEVRLPEFEAGFNRGLDRFLDEARILASFRHPNIARALRYFRTNGTAYIVMEYESGEPLKRWLARQTGFNQQALLQIIRPLLDGLQLVHGLDVLHRDIKPDNIYVRVDGSPVLLDFGAARRTTAELDVEPVVSPGFAPHEQYQSRGNQGPWTDIYALGAVMYWMVTGQKPQESASRIRHGNMARALDTASSGFSEKLLKAIEWAINPDELQRPQSVAEFRAALAGEQDVPATSSVQADSEETNQAVGPRTPARPRKHMVSTIMCTELLGSLIGSSPQLASRERFNELINKALKGVPEDSRVVAETPSGAAICFSGDPEEALQSAMLLRGLLLQKYGETLFVRIGLHLGFVRIIAGAHQQVTVVGDGINVAERIMDFARANQIVVSRIYHDLVCSISKEPEPAGTLFSPLGQHLDKHLRSHELYAVRHSRSPQPPRAPFHEQHFANTSSFAALAPLTPEIAADIEHELTGLIGPLAGVLVRKAAARTTSAQDLRERVSMSIPDPDAREGFLTQRSTTVSLELNPLPIGLNGEASQTGAGEENAILVGR